MSANNKPINAWLPSLAESVPFCPCPPEVSEHIPDTDKAETDGDTPFCELCELPQLDISGAAGVCQCTNFCLCCDQCTADSELDKNNGYCDECEAMPQQLPDQRYYSQSRFSAPDYVVNGSQLPSNLE